MRAADGETIPDLERPRYSCISEAVKFPARRILMEQHKKFDPLTPEQRPDGPVPLHMGFCLLIGLALIM